MRPLAIAFALALLSGILLDWQPRFWREAIPIAAITLVAIGSLGLLARIHEKADAGVHAARAAFSGEGFRPSIDDPSGSREPRKVNAEVHAARAAFSAVSGEGPRPSIDDPSGSREPRKANADVHAARAAFSAVSGEGPRPSIDDPSGSREPRKANAEVHAARAAFSGEGFRSSDSWPRQMLLIIPIALWGPAQLLFHLTRVPWLTEQRSLEWGMGAICFILAARILRESAPRKAFLNLLLWVLTFLAVAAMLQRYITPAKLFGIIPVEDSVVGTMFYKNQFAALMELAAPIALWRVSRGDMVSGGLAFAAMFAATITSESRMGVVLIIAEFLVFTAAMVVRRRMPLRAAVSGAAILALLIGAAAMVAGTETILKRLEEPNAYVMRRKLLDSTLRMIPTHLWVGSGLGTWPDEYPAFATYDDATYVNEAHNDWAQWASEGGIPFALLLAALTIWLAGSSLRSIWGLGLLSVMIHSFVDYPLRDPALTFVWFAFAGALTGVEIHRPVRETQSMQLA